MELYKPTTIITQFAEIQFHLFLQAKEIEVQKCKSVINNELAMW